MDRNEVDAAGEVFGIERKFLVADHRPMIDRFHTPAENVDELNGRKKCIRSIERDTSCAIERIGIDREGKVERKLIWKSHCIYKEQCVNIPRIKNDRV